MSRTFTRYSGEHLVQTARLKLTGIGKYAFETSLYSPKRGDLPYELNINMPLFDTEKAAYRWILGTGKWKEISEHDYS